MPARPPNRSNVSCSLRFRRALALIAAAALAGCGLGPLPRPSVSPCAANTIAAFWACVLASPPPAVRETSFWSTYRAADLGRKKLDQDPGRACRGTPPPGFMRIDDVSMPGGEAPLHALLAPPSPGMPIVIVVHGLYDSKFTEYVTVTAELFHGEGFGVLAPDMRWHGCLLSTYWLPGVGTVEGKDLVAWARWLRARYPGHPIGLVGFSLGGLDVLHAIGEPDAVEVFDAGMIAVSPAAALRYTEAHLDAHPYFADDGLNALALSGFMDLLHTRITALDMPEETTNFGGLADWLARNGPFPPGTTGEDVFREADPVPSLARARRPALVIASHNDPIVPVAGAADLANAAKHNPYARVVVTPYGGHIGQLGLYPDWVAAVMVSFFRASPAVPPAPG